MPVTMEVTAQKFVDRSTHAENLSRGIVTILIAAAAKPAGHMNIGQVSPIRSVSDFQKKYRNGASTAVDSRIATGSRARYTRAGGAQRKFVLGGRAHRLEAERRPIMLVIPDQHRREHGERNQCCQPWIGG